jgi:alpha-tubulin suppressor-like RCC1 family protein
MTHEPRYIDTIAVTLIECGEMHMCALTKNKGVCAWGYGAHGRLGREFSKDYQWIPLPANLPPVNVVNLISCESEHTMLSTLLSNFSFGCGDGGRLGHGDFSDRPYPFPERIWRS